MSNLPFGYDPKDILPQDAVRTILDTNHDYQVASTVRTIAVIAAELQGSIEAAGRIKALKEELHTALGRRPRGPRKAK